MSMATMTSKGQVTIPKEIREELGLDAGSKVLFVRVGPRNVRMVPRTGDVSDLIGILSRPDQPSYSIEELNEHIAEAATEEGSRGLG